MNNNDYTLFTLGRKTSDKFSRTEFTFIRHIREKHGATRFHNPLKTVIGLDCDSRNISKLSTESVRKSYEIEWRLTDQSGQRNPFF